MLLTNDIHDEIYTKFILYAIKKSDVFMLIVDYCSSRVFDANNHLSIVKQYQPQLLKDPEVIKRIRTMEKESIARKKIFDSYCKSFINELSVYKIKERCNPVWPSTEVLSPTDGFEILLFRSTVEVIKKLCTPGSYLSWRYPKYPEDLSFFKNNRCWAYASSHEGYIEIYPDSEEEWKYFKSIGIEFDETEFVYTPEEQRFYEEY